MKIPRLCLILLVLFSYSACYAQEEEKLTITTYYPSPAGVYATLRVVPSSAPACDASVEGKMYYDGTARSLNICSNSTAGVWGYYPVPGPTGGYWALNGANLTPANATWNVGFGTTGPQSYAKIEVNTTGNKAIYTMDTAAGGLLIGYQGATIQARTTAHANTQNLSLQNWGGNVGIGMTNPSVKLDVAGAINASGNVSVGGTLFANCRRSQETINGWQVVSYCPAGTTVISGGCHWATGAPAWGAHPFYNPALGRWGWECVRDGAAAITVHLLCCKIDVQ